MKDAVIVSTARTPIGMAFRGALNNIKSPTLAGHAISHAVDRAGVDPAEIDDLILGSVSRASQVLRQDYPTVSLRRLSIDSALRV